ncbi:MAG: hypothetical protein V3U68_06755 [Bacteroidota bacterium]
MGGPSNGFPEGTLKDIALSGASGSQYATGILLQPYLSLSQV